MLHSIPFPQKQPHVSLPLKDDSRTPSAILRTLLCLKQPVYGRSVGYGAPRDVTNGGKQSVSTRSEKSPPIAEPKYNKEHASTSHTITQSKKNPKEIISDSILVNTHKTRPQDAAAVNTEPATKTPSESSVPLVASQAPNTSSTEVLLQEHSILEDPLHSVARGGHGKHRGMCFVRYQIGWKKTVFGATMDWSDLYVDRNIFATGSFRLIRFVFRSSISNFDGCSTPIAISNPSISQKLTRIYTFLHLRRVIAYLLQHSLPPPAFIPIKLDAQCPKMPSMPIILGWLCGREQGVGRKG
jgi:hypothetical protein